MEGPAAEPTSPGNGKGNTSGTSKRNGKRNDAPAPGALAPPVDEFKEERAPLHEFKPGGPATAAPDAEENGAEDPAPAAAPKSTAEGGS